MKKARAVTYLNSGIFGQEVLFSCGYTYTELLAWLKKKKHFNYHAGLAGQDVKKDLESGVYGWYICREVWVGGKGPFSDYHYIFMPNHFTFSDKDYTILAHECLHFCQQILPNILDRNVEHEAEAHLHSHLMEQCLKALRGQ